MRALTFSRFGGPEVLEVVELPQPEPGPGQTRVRVAAATVNPTDIGFRAGRQAAQLTGLMPPYIPGMELAGVVQGVDGLVDAAVIGAPMLAAIRDGGGMAVVRGFEGDSERGIAIHQVRVTEYAENQTALQALADLVAQGRLILRVSETFALERAAEAHKKMEAGGIRGRLVIVF
jgi:NADPH:quinone reductase-like Zn-dependent oxidoreductase